ncbi:hypothetical protein, variant [Aphanomyces astaci]|uniref:Uncharacterized protein n=1 Tax=Aphanomyces astaci TaxID=112090 RepID=W4FYC0_APHAT|nr:hypothetical protein, variant [Aphanomyces astaci]ETV71653.1 hypothetical protein, variant [Aphanomyces astaci]|eukprot:XP_009838841.1 hypothetical protein, variant [Aphanomyces astaci]
MADLTNAQRQLVANARARKQGRALSLKLKDQAEAERHQHLADKRQKAQQNQKPAVDNKLAIRYVTKDLAQYALHSDWKKKRHRKDKTRASTVPDAKSAGGGNSNQQPNRGAELDIDEDNPQRRPPRYRPPNAWAKLYELEVQEVEKEKVAKRNAVVNSMHVVRSCLMQQEEEKQRRRQQEAERSAKYFEQQQLELTKYKDQLTQLQAAKEEKQKQMSAEINRMVADAHEKRERQKKAKMQAELREVDRAKAALEAERLRLEEDKRLKALQVEQVKVENQKLQDAKRVEKLRLQEYENEMTQAYQKRLAAQELARKADLQKTYERQEKRVSMALLNVVSPEEKARQDEVRAAVVQAAERKKEEARLEEKRRKQRQLDAEQGQELRKQQEEKRNRLEAERQAAAHIDAMGAQDALAAEMAARVKQAKKDAIDREYRTKLAQQMTAEYQRKATMDKWSMSHIEMKLNSTTLKKAGYLHAHTTFFTRNMTKDIDGGLRKPTFTVRDGYHLEQLNHKSCSDVEWRNYPELAPPAATPVKDTPSRPPVPSLDLPSTPSRRRSSVLDCPQTLTPNTPKHRRESLKQSSPIASWLIFRQDSEATSTSKVLPFLSRTPTSPPLTSDPPGLGYAQPHRNIRHRSIKPASKTSLLPHLPVPSPRPSGGPCYSSRRTRYDTQISMIRKRTIVPVADPRSMSLGARILHFKIAPHELQAVLKREDARKLRHITDHGTNLVARNKQLVKPPSNQVERFEVERRRQEEAKARMQAHHRVMADVLAAGVNRWGARKQQAALLRARQHWARKTLLLVALGKITHKLHALYRASEGRILSNQQHRATKRIQHFWRRKSQAICLSHVTHAMLVIQKYLMKWVRKNRLRRRQLAVHVIITSIEELQEAKFRRCILKYRHCIQVFQSMWRGWMSITDARVKLLLLFWAKLERKALDKGATSDDVSKLSLEGNAPSRPLTKRRCGLRSTPTLSPLRATPSASLIGMGDTVKLLEHLNSLKLRSHTGEISRGRSRGTGGSRVSTSLKTSLVKDLLRKKRQEFLALRQEQKELCENQLELRRRLGVGMDARTVLALDNLRFEKSQFLMLQSISEADMLELIKEAETQTKHRAANGLEGTQPMDGP